MLDYTKDTINNFHVSVKYSLTQNYAGSFINITRPKAILSLTQHGKNRVTGHMRVVLVLINMLNCILVMKILQKQQILVIVLEQINRVSMSYIPCMDIISSKYTFYNN